MGTVSLSLLHFLEPFRAELFDCLCLKQTVRLANLFNFDLEMLFRQNEVS